MEFPLDHSQRVPFAPIPTGIELAVCEDIARRQALGVAKYGTTVADNPLSLRAWLQHALEESLDQAIYLKRAIAEIDANSRVLVSPEHPVRYADVAPGANPIRFGEPGYDEAQYEVMPLWKRK